MSAKYKVVRMKEMARQLKLLSAKQFAKTEEYLEYAINEINQNSKFYFHQYLYLVDVLYVTLVLKSSVDASQTYAPPVERHMTGSSAVTESSSATIPASPTTEEHVEETAKEMEKISANKNIEQVKLDW